jgi:hypothetical protein
MCDICDKYGLATSCMVLQLAIFVLSRYSDLTAGGRPRVGVCGFLLNYMGLQPKRSHSSEV